MGMWLGRGRKARRCYGFDEIALVPGAVTINPNEVDTSWEIGNRKFKVPIIASAMDGVVDVDFAVRMIREGIAVGFQKACQNSRVVSQRPGVSMKVRMPLIMNRLSQAVMK